MEKLLVYGLENEAKWNEIIYSFEKYDVYYLSGYVKAFQLHGDGEPMLFYYEDGNIRGINVVMKRDISHDPHFKEKLPENTYFDLATPYGYGGWLIEGSGNIRGLVKAYAEYCRGHHIVSEFVRYHPVLRNHEAINDFYQVTPLGETVCMDLSTPETIWNNLTSKNRNMIRKARKNGVQIYQGRSPKLFKRFRYIYECTMDKDAAVPYYYFGDAFYQSVLTDLPYQAQIFYAVAENEIIAASIMLAANGRLNYHLSGVLSEYQSLAPTNLLLYEAALWGSYNGCTTLHLGGGVGSGEDSLFRFKKSFYRGELCRYHIGKKVFQPDMYQRLLKLRQREELSGGYFPAYRG